VVVDPELQRELERVHERLRVAVVEYAGRARLGRSGVDPSITPPPRPPARARRSGSQQHGGCREHRCACRRLEHAIVKSVGGCSRRAGCGAPTTRSRLLALGGGKDPEACPTGRRSISTLSDSSSAPSASSHCGPLRAATAPVGRSPAPRTPPPHEPAVGRGAHCNDRALRPDAG
jgi:hypothetical protein